MKRLFFKPIKIFWSIVTQKNKQKQSKKRFAAVTKKYLKIEYFFDGKHIWWEVIWEKLMSRMLWNTLKYGLHYLQNKSVSIKVFLLNMHKARNFIWSGQFYTSFNLLCILNFFYKNYWSCLPSSSKCRGSMHHSDIRFWFSGNASIGRHCLLLQFRLSC